MGDIADMMLDGTLCQSCGEYIGDSDGIPVNCALCQSVVDRTTSENTKRLNVLKNDRQRKMACPECGKKVKITGIDNHMIDAHQMQAPRLPDLLRENAELKAEIERLKRSSLESEREWTSVEDGLPEEGVPVLVVSAHWPDSVYAALRIDEGDGWLWAQMGAYGGNLNDVSDYEADDDYQYSHWRPLPTPPAGEME